MVFDLNSVRGAGEHKELGASGDRGTTFIELLIAIVLVSVGVLATLVALQATSIATVVDRDHAEAFEWLQAGADRVYNYTRIPCYDATDPVPLYDAEAKLATAPARWAAGGTIEVVDVTYIGRASSADPYTWSAAWCLESDPVTCPGGLYCESPQTAQKVTLRVTSPNGLIKTLETVKGG